EDVQGLRATDREGQVPPFPLRAQHPPQSGQDGRLVVDEQDVRARRHDDTASSDSGVAGCTGAWIGSRTKNVVPAPGALSNPIVPWCRSTTRDQHSDRPWPVPLPTSFVVKNGSKIRPATSAGTPLPVSA